ncbi:carboxypeptidase-like regulatory domain-containing protein [Chitinophaga filiformis]|uniref:carboxypeptidase-like regulatory domain-containing protein n=1 Tax=Chitinophaga filiformis TaxID=104663 RepID=UPI001F324A51|nr:carboxypeptidase-like regulatory domain-containing protein [Chitinophaga filiformis]MCF6406575.1 carboxypeptidase-like regulatory domain-containing protein [Chitinophaga filiformis]
MTSKILFSLCCLVALYSLFSCTREDLQGPPGPPGDTGMYVPLSGDIRGSVIVYDSTGKALADHSGVIVTIDSTDLKDTTDASGDYNFSQVPAGRYNFSYSKPGYGTYRIIRQLHPGGAQATQVANADVGQIYYGPPPNYVTWMGFGSPTRHEIYPYATFQAPMQIPAALVLYMTVHGSPKTDFVTTQRDYIPIDNYPYEYFGSEISPYTIYSDTVLAKANTIYFSLAFDNPKDINYIDERGKRIYPCTSPILGSFGLSPWDFSPPFGARRQSNDGIYPLLRNFRLK